MRNTARISSFVSLYYLFHWMFSLYYHELLGKVKEYKGKKILDDWWLHARLHITY